LAVNEIGQNMKPAKNRSKSVDTAELYQSSMGLLQLMFSRERTVFFHLMTEITPLYMAFLGKVTLTGRGINSLLLINQKFHY
jgi:hypothetical protein